VAFVTVGTRAYEAGGSVAPFAAIFSNVLGVYGAAVLIYVIGSAAGIKLLKVPGAKKLLPWISLVISIAVLPFVGPLALAGLLTAGAALVYSLMARRARA
jgi:hypothetical protein